MYRTTHENGKSEPRHASLITLCRLLSLIVIVTCIAHLPCNAQKRGFTVADDVALSHFGDILANGVKALTFSPDGRYFVVETESGLLDQNRPESALRFYRTEDVRQFLLHSENKSQPVPFWTLTESRYKDGPAITSICWLSNSSGVAFVGKSSSGNDQLFLADVKTQTLDPLTSEEQNVSDYDVRDRDHFVYSVLSPAIRAKAIAETQALSVAGTGRSLSDLMFPEDWPTIRHQHDLSELWAVMRGKRFRVEGDSSDQPLTLYKDGLKGLALSPDGRSLVTVLPVGVVQPEWEKLYLPPFPSYWRRIRASRQDLHALNGLLYVSEYAMIDLATGKIEPLTRAPTGLSAGWDGWPRADWSADSKSVVLSNTFVPSRENDTDKQMNSPCVAVADIEEGSLTCLERLKGQTKDGYEAGYQYVEQAVFAHGDRSHVTVYLSALNGSKEAKSHVRSSNGSWRTTTTDAALPDNAIDVSIKQSLNDPPVLVATDRVTKTSRAILDPNPQLRNIVLGEVSVFRWKDKTGRDWVAGLYKPPGYSPGQRYPLVIQTHGFAENEFLPSGAYPPFAAQELAAGGVVVLQVEGCMTLNTPEEAPCQVEGYEAAVKRLTADGVVDPDRIGIIGFSRTCYHVMEALTTSTVHFTAASITDGINAGYLQYVTRVDHDENLIAHTYDAIIGARPFGEGLQQWLKRSPEFNLDKVTTPLQVVALGRSKLFTMWEPYAVLRYLNKPVDLIVLAEGTHVLTNPAARMASQGGTVDWFRFWLQGYEDSDPTKAQQYIRWRELRRLQEKNEATRTGSKQ